jgi:hypothetical protein
MKNDRLISALLGTHRPDSVSPETPSAPVPSEGGYRTPVPVETDPAQEHNDQLSDLLATRRFESQQ